MIITNDKLNITEKIKGTRNCTGREIIFAAQCSKHKVLYIGHKGEQQTSLRHQKQARQQ